MKKADSSRTIDALRQLFSYFGIPEHIVTDNGCQFTSLEFEDFLRFNNIQHTCTPVGHPATNGLAEKYVGFFKAALKKQAQRQAHKPPRS